MNLPSELSEFSALPLAWEPKPSASPEREHTLPQTLQKAASFPFFLVQGTMVNISPNPRLRGHVTRIAFHWETALSVTAVPILAASWQSVPLQSSDVSRSRRVLGGKSLSLLISFLLTRLAVFRFAVCVCVVFTNQRGGKGKTTALWFLSAADWRWIPSVVLEVAGFLLDFIFLKLRKQLIEVYGFQELQLWPCISYVELSGGVQAEVSLPVYLSPLFQNGKLQWQTGWLLFYYVYVYLYNVLFQKKKEFKAGKNMDFSSTCRNNFIGFFWYHIYLLMIDMLMIWWIRWVGFIYIIISISSRCVFKETVGVLLKMSPFLA